MLFYVLGIVFCLGAGATAHDCKELGDLGWNVYQNSLKQYPIMNGLLRTSDSNREVFGSFLCNLADIKNMTELVDIFSTYTPFRDESQIRQVYNSLAAYMREKGLEGAKKEISMYLKFSSKLDEWGFPVYPLDVPKEEIISFVQQAFRELGPNAIDRATRGRFPDPKFVLHSSEEVDKFAIALAESNSTMELANNLGWDPSDVQVLAYSFSTGDSLELMKEIIPTLLKIMHHLHQDGFFNINHREPNPFGYPAITPECQELGEKLFALKDFTKTLSCSGPVSYFYTDKPEYILGEFIKINIENEDHWTSAACWLQGLTSMEELVSQLELPHEADLPKLNQFLSTMNDDNKLDKFILNMGVLLPTVKASGLPKFPLRISYGEIYSTFKYLVENVGPDFMQYLKSPMYPVGPQYDFNPITHVGYVAKAYSEAKSVSDLAQWLNVTEDAAMILAQPLPGPMLYAGDRYLSMARLMATVLESLKAIGFFELKM